MGSAHVEGFVKVRSCKRSKAEYMGTDEKSEYCGSGSL